jgi:hypothetical protein
MDNGEKRLGATTKRLGRTTKRSADEMTEKYSTFGAYGDYTVTTSDGKKVPIASAISIRMLDHGELNLVTDAGRWFLFAPNSWTTVVPDQPKPGNSDVG